MVTDWACAFFFFVLPTATSLSVSLYQHQQICNEHRDFPPSRFLDTPNTKNEPSPSSSSVRYCNDLLVAVAWMVGKKSDANTSRTLSLLYHTEKYQSILCTTSCRYLLTYPWAWTNYDLGTNYNCAHQGQPRSTVASTKMTILQKT